MAKHQVEAEGTTRGEPGGSGPGQRSRRPASQFAPLARVSLAVGGNGPVELGVVGEVPEAGVVAVPGGDDAPRSAHPAHLGQGGHRVPHVLEHLMGVDHVEGAVGEPEVEDVADLEATRPRPASAGGGPGLGQDPGGGIDTDHPAGRHPRGQVAGDRARTAAHVQQRQPGRSWASR